MALKVWNEEKQKEDLYLQLTTDVDGDIRLIVCDAAGNTQASLLYFDCNDKQLYLCCEIDPELGFPLDDKGRLQVE